jgi:hypothetical protein
MKDGVLVSASTLSFFVALVVCAGVVLFLAWVMELPLPFGRLGRAMRAIIAYASGCIPEHKASSTVPPAMNSTAQGSYDIESGPTLPDHRHCGDNDRPAGYEAITRTPSARIAELPACDCPHMCTSIASPPQCG